MGRSNPYVLDEHGLEEPHIPVPAGHAPRLLETDDLGGLTIYERLDPRAHIHARNPVDVRE